MLTIEASAPVPYVASQPDARTTLVEMRDVVAQWLRRHVKIHQRHPVDAVNVESAVGPTVSSIARVRITFRQPIRPRIRSSRNVILVEADRVDGTAIGPKVDACMRRSRRPSRRPDHAAWHGNGRDPPRNGAARRVERSGAKGRARRLIVSSAGRELSRRHHQHAPRGTGGQTPNLNQSDGSLGTQVTMDLSRDDDVSTRIVGRRQRPASGLRRAGCRTDAPLCARRVCGTVGLSRPAAASGAAARQCLSTAASRATPDPD